jgi:hypothetical protein
MLGVRVLPDPLRLVACYSWKDGHGWRVRRSRKPSPGRPGLGFDSLSFRRDTQSTGHWSRGSGRPLLRREVEGSSPSCPTFRQPSSDGRALPRYGRGRGSKPLIDSQHAKRRSSVGRAGASWAPVRRFESSRRYWGRVRGPHRGVLQQRSSSPKGRGTVLKIRQVRVRVPGRPPARPP